MTRSKVPNRTQRVVEMPAGAEGAGGKRARMDEPSAVILAGDILRWVIPKVGKFPKNVRFGLGARLEAAHFDVLEELIRAQYARGGDLPLNTWSKSSDHRSSPRIEVPSVHDDSPHRLVDGPSDPARHGELRCGRPSHCT